MRGRVRAFACAAWSLTRSLAGRWTKLTHRSPRSVDGLRCLGLPSISDDRSEVRFQGNAFRCAYKEGALGWISVIVDAHLQPARLAGDVEEELAADGDGDGDGGGGGGGGGRSGSGSGPTLWIGDDLLACLNLAGRTALPPGFDGSAILAQVLMAASGTRKQDAGEDNGGGGGAGGDDSGSPSPGTSPNDDLEGQRQAHLLGHLMMWMPENGNDRFASGTWIQLEVFAHRPVVQAFTLCEHGRRVQRMMSYTSDRRFTLGHLALDVKPKDVKPHWLLAHEAGSFFGFAAPVPLCEPTKPSYNNHSGSSGRGGLGHSVYQSVVISRTSLASSDTVGEETFVPNRFLRGVLPHALLRQRWFFQDGARCMRGYAERPSHSSGSTTAAAAAAAAAAGEQPTDSERPTLPIVHVQLRVRIVRGTGGGGGGGRGRGEVIGGGATVVCCDATVTLPDADGDVAGARSGDGQSRKTLMNHVVAAPKTTTLGRLCDWTARLQDSPHTLVWSRSLGHVGEEVPISEVQLRLINARFRPRYERVSDGGSAAVARLCSLDYDGLFVSDARSASVAQLLRGLPHSVLLADRYTNQSVMVLALPLVRPAYTNTPFSTEVVQLARYDSRFYVYPVHPSGVFLQPKSLAASLYLVALRFLHRDYVACSRLLTGCASDVPFTSEEAWAFRCVGAAADDMHPDASATRLRLALLAFGTGPAYLRKGTLPFDVEVDYFAYLDKLSHVSACCLLRASEEVALLGYMREAGMAVAERLRTRMHFVTTQVCVDADSAAAACGGSGGGAASAAASSSASAAAAAAAAATDPPLTPGGSAMSPSIEHFLSVPHHHSVESQHPYRRLQGRRVLHRAVHVSGATHLTITFSDLSCTADGDQVEFFTDESLETRCAGTSTYSGDAGWPGTFGTEPLTVAGDTIVAVFTTGGASAGTANAATGVTAFVG